MLVVWEQFLLLGGVQIWDLVLRWCIWHGAVEYYVHNVYWYGLFCWQGAFDRKKNSLL